jgi:hypothetical protein
VNVLGIRGHVGAVERRRASISSEVCSITLEKDDMLPFDLPGLAALFF